MIGVSLLFYMQVLAVQLAPVAVVAFVVLFSWFDWPWWRAALGALALFAGAYLACA